MSLFLDKEREGSVLCLCYHTQCEQYGGKAKMGKCRLLASELNIYALSVLIYSQGAPFSGRKAAKVVTTLRPTVKLEIIIVTFFRRLCHSRFNLDWQ